MAIITFHQPLDMLSDTGFRYGYVQSATPSSIVIGSGGNSTTYYGSFRFSATDLLGGTVTGVTVTTNYRTSYTVTALNLDALDVYGYMQRNDAMGLIQFATAGSDTFNGSYGNDVMTGYGSDDVLRGNGGSDTLYGGDGNDALHGGPGADVLIGDSGTDTALYDGARSEYTIRKSGNGYTVTSARDGVDTLVLVERAQFADARVALDVAGSAGQAYRLYEAALNRTPDTQGLGFYINSLDRGASLSQVAQGFINSPEFQQKYGALNNPGFVNLLYENVLGRAADAQGLAYHVGRLNAGTSRAEVLVGFSESPENQAALMGVMEAGVIYG